MPDAPAAQASHADVVNVIRALAMDAVQKANSGHPGMPMGMAEIAEVLWRRHLRHNPANPKWVDRDRFVLSNGHGSMLQYALLHLAGYDLPARTGRRERGRDGDRREAARGRVQPSGLRDCRPWDVRLSGRRLHDGG